MAQIVTLTFNPVIDKSTTVQALVPEKKLRCSAPKFEPGGGGINVARAIKKLGGDALAVYPAGSYTGKFFQILMEREGVASKVIDIKNNTRENLIVLESKTNQQFRFGMPGPELAEEEWRQCLKVIEEIKDLAFIVASGSMTPGLPTDIYAQLSKITQQKKAKLVVDTSGEPLKEAAKAGVYLLKPNLAELSSLVGKEEIEAEMVEDVARELIENGKCEVIMVSMGAAGAVLVTKDEVAHAVPPTVKRRSTVGAGDCMVAGAVLSLSKGWTVKEALQYGVASGTAATMNPGTELCKLEDVERLYKIMRRSP
jgi:6-phosphofructokinase 2